MTPSHGQADQVIRAADYPPPFDPAEFIAPPTDPADLRIEVGALVVGAGPAGLACAIRFGQLLAEDPETAERLGEVPLAILEKGKQPGSHLLSGAVVNPRSLSTLLGRGGAPRQAPQLRAGAQRGGLRLGAQDGLAHPAPSPDAQPREHRLLAFRARSIPGRPRRKRWGNDPFGHRRRASCSSSTVRSSACAAATRVAARDGEELPNFEPGNDIVAKVTILAEGTQGHLSGVALDHFGLRPDTPQVFELGVKEVWRVPRPLRHVIHTMGWPLRTRAKYREFGGSFLYPMGEDMVTIGMVVGLDYRDAELSVHDLLQELKTHPKIAAVLEGGERLEWGAKTIPSGGFSALPQALHAPGLLLCGDGAGMVNIPTLKGVHYAIESGRLAAETAFAALRDQSAAPEEGPLPPLEAYDAAVRRSFIWSDLQRARDMRGVFARGFFVGGALASIMELTGGRVSLGKVRPEPDDAQPLITTGRAERYPAPDGTMTFDKLSSVFAAANRTRDDQPNHIRIEQHVPPLLATMWTHLCPAQVYGIGPADEDGLVQVTVSPSNCVQCGAISAKGGRLTPPEGGSGPEYTHT